VDDVERRKFLTLPGLEARPLGCPASKFLNVLSREAPHYAVFPATDYYSPLRSKCFSQWPVFKGAGIAQSVYRLATGWATRGGGSSSPGGVKNFHFSISSRPALGSAQPPIKWVPGAVSGVVKRQGSEADHSPPS
jgi:hypothetical protein